MCHHLLRFSEDCVDFNMYEEKKEPKKATSIVEKKLSEGLEEAAENIYKTPFGTRAEDFKAGAEWQKAKTLEDAVEIEVKEDAGGFPIVSLGVIELYDYENDKPLAKAGDKVHIIVLTKEDESHE